MTKLAVIIPCKNEGTTIACVLEKLAEQNLQDTVICVVDNSSEDDTVIKAKSVIEKNSNMVLLSEEKTGKANALKKAVNTIDAEIYCFVDGDFTYDTKGLEQFVEIMEKDQIDLINVKRKAKDKSSFKSLRKFGNIFFNKLFSCLFECNCTDILSGYKLLRKDFLKSCDFKTKGFEIEAEIHIMASKKRIKVKEFDCDYFPRPKDSNSKLSIFGDGFKILKFIFKSYFQEKNANNS